MKLFQAIAAVVFFASGAVAEACIEKELTDDNTYFDDGGGSRMVTFGRDKLRKGSNEKVVGFVQGYCIKSPGPEDKQGEICSAVLEIKSETIHVQYFYPTYKNGGDGPDKFDAIITVATGCYKGYVNKVIPAKWNDDGKIVWQLDDIHG